jgi:hypothetical protein
MISFRRLMHLAGEQAADLDDAWVIIGANNTNNLANLLPRMAVLVSVDKEALKASVASRVRAEVRLSHGRVVETTGCENNGGRV